MSTPWNHNITWLANSKRARSGAASSRSQSKRKESTERPEEEDNYHHDEHHHQLPPSFNIKEAITTMTAYTLNNAVLMGDVLEALDYATSHPSHMADISQCIARNSTRLFRSLHTALTSNYLQAVRIYTSIVERVFEYGGQEDSSSSSSLSSTPALLSALLHESENVKLLLWVVEDSVTRLLGTDHILDVIISRNESERAHNEVRLATPQSDVIDAIHHLLCGVIIPLISSCATGPTSSHGVLETKLKGELVREGIFQVLFNTIDYCNLWLAGSARFVKDGIKTVDDILSGPSAASSPLTEESKLLETFRLNTQGSTPSTVVGSLLRLGRTSATALIHLLKASKETKKIFVGGSDCGVDSSPSFALRAIAGVYHASDSYLQLQLCEGLVRGYAYDRTTFHNTTIPQDKAHLQLHCKGGSDNHMTSFINVLMMGIASLPSDATLIPQCRRLLRNLEDRQRGGEGSPLRRTAGSGGSSSNNLAEVPPLTATFDVLRVEFGVDSDGATTTTTASQRGGELFLSGDDDEDDSSSTTNAETTTVVFSPMFFLLRPPTTATSDGPAPNPFTIPHDRITSVKLTRDKRFGFKLTPSAFEECVLAEDRRAGGGVDGVHPSALLHDSNIVTNLITTVTNNNGGGNGGGADDSSDLLRLLLYMQRCDMKIRPSLYRQHQAPPATSYMLYLCTTSATITAITSSNLQVWIKRAKAAYTSSTITAPDPLPAPAATVEVVTNPTAAIGRNQALSFVGGGEEDVHDRRSSRLLPPSASSSVAPLNGDRRSMGSTTSSHNSYMGRGSVQSHDPDMFGENNHHYSGQHHSHTTPTGSSLPLRGVVASVSDAISAANEAGKYKARLAVVERCREMIEARTAQYKLNHRLRRQEFEEVIVKPVFENVLNGSISDGTARITTTTHGGSTTTPQESTLSGFDADIKSTVLSLNEQLESIEAVGDSIVDVIQKLKEEYGDGVDAVERRRKSQQSTNHDDDNDEDVPIDREMLSPIQRKQQQGRNSTVLRDIVKSMEKQALEAIKERVERKLGGLEAQMKEVLERRCALEDPSPVIRSFAARQRAQDEEDHNPVQDRRRRTSQV